MQPVVDPNGQLWPRPTAAAPHSAHRPFPARPFNQATYRRFKCDARHSVITKAASVNTAHLAGSLHAASQLATYERRRGSPRHLPRHISNPPIALKRLGHYGQQFNPEVTAWAAGRSSSSNVGHSTAAVSSGTVYRAAVGIDLGTTTSAVAVSGPDGRPVVVEDAAGRAVIPSVVFVQQDGSVLVGDEAMAAAVADPANAFYGVKRLMGRTYREAMLELDEEQQQQQQPQQQPQQQGLRRRLRSYSLQEGRGGRVEVACPALGRTMTPPEVSAHLVRHLVSRAQAYLQKRAESGSNSGAAGGDPASSGGVVQAAAGSNGGSVLVLDAVVTVPAHFGPAQRRAVMEAAKAAGLQRVTLLQEPIAAALAYGFGSPTVPYDVLLVFDLGGGTLDLTIVESFDGIMEVLSTSGDNYLGGDDFTAAVADWLAEQLRQRQLIATAATTATAATAPQQHLAGPSQGTSADGAPTELGTHSASTTAADIATAATAATAASDPFTSLELLRLAEAAKLALSEAETAARLARPQGNDGSSEGSTGRPSALIGSGAGGAAAVRLRLPRVTHGSGDGRATAAVTAGSSSGGGAGCGWMADSLGGESTPAGAAATAAAEAEAEAEGGEVVLSHATFEELVRPLLRRVWWPLERLALATRTQLAGRLPPALDPRAPTPSTDGPPGDSSSQASRASSTSNIAYVTAAPGPAFTSAASVSGSGSVSGSMWDDLAAEGPGRRDGAAAWEFSIFAPPRQEEMAGGAGKGAVAAAKYVAPPRRLTGVVLVGAATRLPVVRDYITEVTGLPIRSGVDPETAVALGAALHAGLMSGSVAGGIEMNDGGYVANQHGRASGFQTAAAVLLAGGAGLLSSASGDEVMQPQEEDDEGLVWEP